MQVSIFIPCFMDQLYPQTGLNMAKVLRRLGCELNYPQKQTCCGQPAYNAGFLDEAKVIGKKWLLDFEKTEYIVCPSASCVGYLKNYLKTLFKEAEFRSHIIENLCNKIFELSDFIVNVLKTNDTGAVLYAKATYHDSCAALRECLLKNEPRILLSNVKGLELIEMDEVETCCGFGGSFAVKFASISIAMADQKITNALKTEAQYIISTDASCLLHLQGRLKNQGQSLNTLHLADVLAMGW